MSYRIKMLVDGLHKEDVIENGNLVSKKLERGQIVEVNSVDRTELEARYYKVVVGDVVSAAHKPIKRSRNRVSSEKAPVASKEELLTSMIQNMGTMMQAASEVLQAIKTGEEVPEPEIAAEEPGEAENQAEEANKQAASAIFDDQGALPQEFMTSDTEADEEIYDENSFRKGNDAYQNVLENTLMHGYAGGVNSKGRSISKIANLSTKKMPTVSEANFGKVDPKIKALVLGADGKPANFKKSDMVKIVENEGKIDVIKTLGIKMVNQPQTEDIGI